MATGHESPVRLANGQRRAVNDVSDFVIALATEIACGFRCLLRARPVTRVFCDDLSTQLDTLITDIHPTRASDQAFDLILALATKRAAILLPTATTSQGFACC